MKVAHFDTDLLPASERLRAFQAGAVDFRVDAIGDPLDFCARWQLLKLGDVNAIRSAISPVHYRRDPAMIEADGGDRIAVHYYLQGGSVGELDRIGAHVGVGGAMVWDLTRPIDLRSTGPLQVLIITLPRYMLAEVLPATSYSAVLPPSPELALAAEQLGYMLDRVETLPESGAVHLGRALRDLFALAMLPTLHSAPRGDDPDATPLVRRICDTIDSAAARDVDEEILAAELRAPLRDVQTAVRGFGGLPLLIERRRLLAAYRLLSDPREEAPISAIAWRCGFTNLSRFSRRFRAVFHTSPSGLRQRRSGVLPRWAGAYSVERNYDAMKADDRTDAE